MDKTTLFAWHPSSLKYLMIWDVATKHNEGKKSTLVSSLKKYHNWVRGTKEEESLYTFFSLFHCFTHAGNCKKEDIGAFTPNFWSYSCAFLFLSKFLFKLSISFLLTVSSYYRIWQTTISNTQCSYIWPYLI